MKKLKFLIALLASVLLISCSENTTEPINQNDVNKSLDAMDEFPYDYLQSFEEMRIKDWNLPRTQDDNQIRVQFDRNIEAVEDLFIVVHAGNPTQDDEGEFHLYFVNQPGRDIISVSNVFKDQAVKGVKAFVLRHNIPVDDLPPYEHGYAFRSVYANWGIEGDQLVIVPLPWTPDVVEVYVQIERLGRDELIYLQLPATGKIVLSNYDVSEVQGVRLFVNSLVSVD